MSVCYCCINFLEVNMYLMSDNAVVIMKPFSAVMIWLILFFLLCDYGGRATNQFTSLGDSCFKMSWYHLPANQQKYLVLMIANAERPVYLEGFVIQCTREIFKKVRNGSIYFLLNSKEQLTICFLFLRL